MNPSTREVLRWAYEPPNQREKDKAALVVMRGRKLEAILTGRKATIFKELLDQHLPPQVTEE